MPTLKIVHGAGLRKFFIGLTIMIIIGCNTYLVDQYAVDKFTLPLWLQQLLGKSEAELSNFVVNKDTTAEFARELEPFKPHIYEQIKQSSPGTSTNPVGVDVDKQMPLRNELPFVGGTCAKGRFGTKQKDKSFYLWSDSAGIRHISDTPPKIDNNTPISIVGSYPPAQFITRFVGTTISHDFQNKLSQRLDRLAQEFAQVVDVSAVREVGLNFRFFTQQADFEQYKKRVAPTTPAQRGFYLQAENEMTILVDDEQSGLNTSIHEAVHAINRALFGSMARWLNEGLAQVLATNTAGSATSNSEPSVSLAKLFKATNDDWDGPLRNSLYQSSNAFIERLMNTEHGRETIARLLLAEQDNGCVDLNIDDVMRLLG